MSPSVAQLALSDFSGGRLGQDRLDTKEARNFEARKRLGAVREEVIGFHNGSLGRHHDGEDFFSAHFVRH
ncbi:MAG TPA: hypothetical protein VLN25_08810, partial [Burkholderiaceae bacterium]|nr:hypothetical protein [Burkholderiaceae bacterium]